MSDALLILNAGSSSVKFLIFGTAEDRSLSAGFHGSVEEIETAPHFAVSTAEGVAVADRRLTIHGHDAAIGAIHDWFADHVGREDDFASVGHQVVHGGRDHGRPILSGASHAPPSGNPLLPGGNLRVIHGSLSA